MVNAIPQLTQPTLSRANDILKNYPTFATPDVIRQWFTQAQQNNPRKYCELGNLNEYPIRILAGLYPEVVCLGPNEADIQTAMQTLITIDHHMGYGNLGVRQDLRKVNWEYCQALTQVSGTYYEMYSEIAKYLAENFLGTSSEGAIRFISGVEANHMAWRMRLPSQERLWGNESKIRDNCNFIALSFVVQKTELMQNKNIRAGVQAANKAWENYRTAIRKTGLKVKMPHLDLSVT